MSYKSSQDRQLPGFPFTARDKRQAKGSRKSRKQSRHAYRRAK